MPKMKTKSVCQEAVQDHRDRQGAGAAAGKRHGMIKRTNKFIRNARGTMVLAEPDGRKVIKNYSAERSLRPVATLDFKEIMTWHV